MTRSHRAGDVKLNDGAEQGTQNVLDIPPLSPIEVSKDWNIMVRPDYGPNWQIRAQVQFMFPK